MDASILTVLSRSKSYDLVTLAAARVALGSSSSIHDDQLRQQISQASGMIADYCCRVFVRETVRERWRTRHSLRKLRLARRPVASVSSVVENGITVDSAEYELDSEGGALYRIQGDVVGRWYGGVIDVTYAGGYPLDEIPEALQAACVRMIREVRSLASRDATVRAINVPGVVEEQYGTGAGGAQPPAIPQDVQDILSRYAAVTSG